MSLLLDHGHPDAWDYPLAVVNDEAGLVIERLNGQIGSNAVGFQMAYVSARSEGGTKLMTEYLEKLRGD